MAANERFEASHDADASDNKEKAKNKKRAPKHVPLGLNIEKRSSLPPEEQQRLAAEALLTVVADKESKKKKKKKSAEATKEDNKSEVAQDSGSATETEPAVGEAASTDQVEDDPEAVEQVEDEEATELLAEDSVELNIAETGEEQEFFVSERWSEAEQQSPPRSRASEVGQPLVVAPEVVAQPAVPVAEAVPAEQPRPVEHVPVPQEAAPQPVEFRPMQPESTPVTPPLAAEQTPVVPVPPHLQPSHYGGETPANPLFAQTPPLETAPVASATERQQVEVQRERGPGFGSGLFVGGLIEHFRHRRRERRLQKDRLVQERQIEQLQQQHDVLLREHAASISQESARAQQPVAHESTPRIETMPFPVFAQRAEAPAVGAPEQSPRKEKVPVPAEIEGENPPEVPEGHHIETSSWHHIEVDDKTGRAVENPSFAYGEAFQREQQHERLVDDQTQSSESSTQESAVSIAPTLGANDIPTLPQPQSTATGGQSPVHDDLRSSSDNGGVSRQTKVLHPGADLMLWSLLGIIVLVIIIALAI